VSVSGGTVKVRSLLRWHNRFGHRSVTRSFNFEAGAQRIVPSQVDFADSDDDAINNSLSRSSSHAQQT
jgi:hypothetical protein